MGWLNRGSRFAIGWSAHGFKRQWGVKMTRTVFRVKVFRRHYDWFHGGFL
jgi:hypothetical protein